MGLPTRSLNSVLDVTHGILYLVVAVTDPHKPQTIVITVLQDAAGMPSQADLSAICPSRWRKARMFANRISTIPVIGPSVHSPWPATS